MNRWTPRRGVAGLIRGLTSPAGIVWILCHTIMVLIGALFLTSDFLHKSLGQGVSDGIGGSLVATGIAGASLFVYILTGEKLRSRIQSLTDAGIAYIYPVRSVLIRSEYHKRLASARRIDLVGYGLSAFRQDYLNDFVGWSQRGHVRILLIDPDFPTRETSLADQRDTEEGHPIGQTRDDVLEFERAVSTLSRLDRSRFQVRRMRSIPAINMFRIDDDVFWGPYLMGQQSRNTATLLVTRGGYLFEMLVSHFEQIWLQGCPTP